jgi:carbon-monoxide dehydrogenase catalytic subunit
VGSCVDNSRILTVAQEMVSEGGIGRDFSELPIAASAPGWWSEKAIAIGFYAVASGITTFLGSPFNILGSEAVTRFVTDELEGLVGARFTFESDPIKSAQLIVHRLERRQPDRRSERPCRRPLPQPRSAARTTLSTRPRPG